ncbi:hypothetical protein BJV78DRAFT_1238794 [Lactifluus subvellereus]|nr:hypothetical protein BJV78DRAFT_1238794 [Lactifluus subvellereus]
MSVPLSSLSLLPFAIKNESIINAERYMSAAALAILVYDYLLTSGDEIRYIWRRPVTSIKVLYLLLRYGVALGQIVFFQALSGLITHMTHKVRTCIWSLIVVSTVGSMSLVLGNYVMIIRVYTLWDHRKVILRTLYIGHTISVCATIAFIITSITELWPKTIYEPYIFRMCLIKGRSPNWIGIWLSQALFDVFLFILTIFNVASRPRRVDVKIITDLERDGCVFYLVLFGEHYFCIGNHVLIRPAHFELDAL